MFKADISNCFNQLHWQPNTAKLMGFMLITTLLMLMLTCGFGVAVTPMIWAVIGDALNRKINRVAPSRTFSYFDEFFGAGTYNDTAQTQKIVHDTITNVLGPDGISVKKNIHSQTADLPTGILIDLPTATMRPKDNAIEKLFYVLFRVYATTSLLAMPGILDQPVLAGSPRDAPFRGTTNTHDPQRAQQFSPQSQCERAIRH